MTPEPKKRPKSSYIRFEAAMPNETWQSDFTHYRLTRPDGRPGTDVEIITWLDDCTRYALHVTAHRRSPPRSCKPTFREAAGQHGIPASTLTDNGMVYTVRLAGLGRQGGRNGFEQQLRDWNVVQKNSRPNHPTTCGKVERFQQTMKKWLRAQPDQPATIAELQPLLDRFRRPSTTTTDHTAPCPTAPPRPRSTTRCPRPYPDRAATPTPTTGSATTASTSPAPSPCASPARLRHIGIGRTHAGTHVILLVQDLNVRIVNAITGELLRDLTIDPDKDYQPRTPNPKNTRTHVPWVRVSPMS